MNLDVLPLAISDITLTNFRCFKKLSVSFDASVVLIEGDNGTGKTSLLEALHYGCYLRSFRESSPCNIIAFEQPAFSIALRGTTCNEPWQLVVGASAEQRMVKFNGAPLKTHKQILDYYRTITITEDDINLLAGPPQERRTFLDSTLFLLDTDYGDELKHYAKIVKQRAALLAAPYFDKNGHDLWTEKFHHVSGIIQDKRRALLTQLESKVQELLRMYIPHTSHSLSCEYAEKKCNEDLLHREKALKRVLFGAHFDDVHIVYGNSRARTYASRGQQKMLVVLFKLAALQLINKPTVLLLDDFMTDFDQKKIEQVVMALMAERTQIIATCPMEQSIVAHILKQYDAHIITLQPPDTHDHISENFMRIQSPLHDTAV